MTDRRGFWIAASAVLIALAVAALWTTTLDHDVAWSLHMIDVARRGGRLYRDVIDTNPPLIVYLLWPSAWLATISGLGSTNAFRLYECAAALGATVAAAGMIRRVWPSARVTARGMVGLTITFALFPFLRHDFGQREHFAVMLTLPYVLLAAITPARRVRGRAADLAIGAAAGLGFSLKPQFIVAWAALELFLLVTGRGDRSWRRPELMASVLVAAACGLFVYIAVPDYLVVAQQARIVNASQRAGLGILLGMPDLAIWAGAAALLIFVRLSAGTRRPVLVLFVAATGFLIAGLIQRRGWTYQMYPARAYMAVFVTTFVLALFDTAPGVLGVFRGGLRSAAFLLTGALLSLSVRYATAERISHKPDLVGPLITLLHMVQRARPAGPLATLSMRTIVYPSFPAVNETGAAWSLRHNGMWFLPGLYQQELLRPNPETNFRTPPHMAPIEREYFEEIIGDLCAHPPAILLVEPPVKGAPEGRRSLDLVAYYQQDPRFLRLFRNYSLWSTLGTFTVYTAPATASCLTP